MPAELIRLVENAQSLSDEEIKLLSLPNREEFDDFLMRLPEISGLEMLMLVNPLPDPVAH